MLNNKLDKLNKIECSWVDLRVTIMCTSFMFFALMTILPASGEAHL
jgi:hypothetical protein